jgi:hypothetical protein
MIKVTSRGYSMFTILYKYERWGTLGLSVKSKALYIDVKGFALYTDAGYLHRHSSTKYTVLSRRPLTCAGQHSSDAI